MSLNTLTKELKSLGNKGDVEILQRFFKTAPGEYGEGDVFIGIRVPVQRKVAQKHVNLAFNDIQKLLNNKIHEFRLVGLLILINKYEDADNDREKERIFNFYLKNTKAINNWDLVDLSADKIVGDFLFHNPKKKNILDELVGSNNLWERRIAMISTYAFIKKGKHKEAVSLAKRLLGDEHDLMHKAVGWMLREMGKRIDEKLLINFLDNYSHKMARTTLRYSIEKLPEAKRQYYLKK